MLNLSWTFYILTCVFLLQDALHFISAQPFASPWYLQNVKTSSIASSTTDILATTDNGTHIFVVSSDSILHLFSYSAAGGPTSSVDFIGQFTISPSVQQGINSGLDWRTSSAFALEYNKYNKDLYAITYTLNGSYRELRITVIDSGNFSSMSTLKYGGFQGAEPYWLAEFANPRFSTFVDSSHLYVGIFNDPSITGTQSTIGFWLSKSAYQPGTISVGSHTSSSPRPVLAIDFECNLNPSIICIWTSHNSLEEYSTAFLTTVRSVSVGGTFLRFNPSIAKNSSDKSSYYLHRSVNLVTSPFVLYKRSETFQQITTTILPFQINFPSPIPEFGVRVGSRNNVFVGFSATLNYSISYGDYEMIVCDINADSLGVQGYMIISTIGKENFARVIPQNDNGFVVIGRTNGRLDSPNSTPGFSEIIALQFVPLKITSILSARPMRVLPNEVIQVQFESLPVSFAGVVPSVRFNGLLCTSVVWVAQNTLSTQIPGSLTGIGPYDLWVVFDSVSYKPSVKVSGILAVQLQIFSVHPAQGSTLGFNITLITSDMGIVQEQIIITVGGKSCGDPFQLNGTAFGCTVPPGTGRNKLVVIYLGAMANSAESVFINYNPPVIASVSPTSSPTLGGKTIYISGNGFGLCSSTLSPCEATSTNLSILIGSTQCLLPILYNDSCVSCVTPELAGQNLPLLMQVNGQNSSTALFSSDIPKVSSVLPKWILSSNPTMYIEGANFGPANARRSIHFHELNTTQSFVCPVVTWLSHSSLKCDFTNISLPLYSRFNISVWVEGQQNAETDFAEFRTGSVNAPPVVRPVHAVVKEDELLFLEIYSFDPNSEDIVQVFVSSNPHLGTLYQITPTGSKGSLINASLASVPVLNSQSRILYVPLQNLFGNDSFQVFAMDDKGIQSPVETVSITIDAVPDPPVPRSATIILDEDSTAFVEFVVDDPDQADADNITLTILSLPRYGSLMIQDGIMNSSSWIEIVDTPFVLPTYTHSAIYRPLKDGYGSPYDSIVFKANDQNLDSTLNGTIVLNVRPVNDPPVFNRSSLNLTVIEDTPAVFGFNITDVDKDDLLIVKIHNLSIAGSLYPFSQNLGNSDITRSSPLGEGSEIKGPPYQLLFVPQKDVFTEPNKLQSFDISYSDRVDTIFEAVTFEIAAVNDSPQLSCDNPNVMELSTEFITNTSATAAIRIIAADVDDTNLTYHLIEAPVKGNLIVRLTNTTLQSGDIFSSPELTYFSNSNGGIYPHANFTIAVMDSLKATSENCTYLFSFKCPPGLVNNIFNGNGPICTECLEGAICSSDGSQFPYPKYGWWRSHDNTTFLPCFPMNACPGSPFLPCSIGYTGTRCGRCSPGYYRLNDGCRKCGEQGAAVQIILIIAVIILIACAFNLIIRISRKKRGAAFGLVCILVNFIQTILLLRQMRLNWPEPLLHLFSWLSFINFNVELVSPECLVTEESFNFSFKMKLSLSIPLFALIFALSVPCVDRIIVIFKPSVKKPVGQSPDGITLVRIFKAYMSFLNLLFVHVATSSLAMFDCTKEADNLSYLDSDPSLRCYESWYYQDLPYAMAGLWCYVLGIPVVSVILSYAARRARDKPAEVNSIWHKFQLFSEAIMNTNQEFKTNFQFMSVVQLFQKLFMVVVNIFFTRYVGLQIILTLLFLFSNVELVARWRPYGFPVLNMFDILSNVASMLVLGLGLTFHFDRLSNSLHGLVIIILIIIIICGFIIWVVLTIIRESFSHLKVTTKFVRFRQSNAETSKVEVSEGNAYKTSKAFPL